jgi:hypothetical protein
LSNEDDKGRRAQEVLKMMRKHKLELTSFILKKVESLMKPTGKKEMASGAIQYQSLISNETLDICDANTSKELDNYLEI